MGTEHSGKSNEKLHLNNFHSIVKVCAKANKYLACLRGGRQQQKRRLKYVHLLQRQFNASKSGLDP